MDDFSHLIGTFIAESRDFLQSMEENLLAMEEDETLEDREKRVQQLFRAAHSIKGAALMFGLETVADVAHTLEDCFGILRDRADLTSLNPDTITDLLNGVDRLKELVEKTSRNEPIVADEIAGILPIKTRLQERYGSNQSPERSQSDSPISADIIRTIFDTELPPLLDRLEAELSQVTAETQAKTLAQLNEIYYQLSGMGAMLELPEFSRLAEPLRELIDSPELSPESLQKQGLAIAESLGTARDRVLEGKPITGANTPAETPPEPVLEKTAPPPTQNWQRPTIRVDLEHLTELVNLVGELVIHRTHLEVQQAQVRSEAKRIRRNLFELNQFGGELRDEYDRLSIHPQVKSRSRSHLSRPTFDPLELDRYTEFHSTAQSVIETTDAIARSSARIDELSIGLDANTEQIRRITDQLRSRVYNLRVVPFSRCVDHLPRALRDLCRAHDKDVNLLLLGRETKIDESLVDALRDPLVQLLRNAFDHGIEPPEERRKTGKPASGQIEIAAGHQGGQTVVSVADDGRGIDPEAIRKKAIANGMVAAEQATDLSLADLYEFLFAPGFSTASTATQLSGRGVGLDVVRTNLRKVRGSIKVDSRPGKGTRFILKLPLMLSIASALLVRVDHNTVALPLDAVEEILHLEAHQIQMAGNQPMLPWRGEFIRLVRLQELLHYSLPNPDGPSPDPLNQDYIPVLVVASAEGILAIAIERLVGQQEIVVKPLPSPLSKPPGIVGSTILGDGNVVMILDVDDLIAGVNPATAGTTVAVQERAAPTATSANGRAAPTILVVDDSYTIRQLLSVLLKRAHYRVFMAKDGQEALDQLQGGIECDLVIADIEMPKIDGFELLRTLKSQPVFRDLPVAMLTSRSGMKHRQLAISLGASEYFTKPYNENQLLEAIATLVNH
ncbi:MAG: hybrid sensor histidine kinase/response regulator [Limnospira sp.]